VRFCRARLELEHEAKRQHYARALEADAGDPRAIYPFVRHLVTEANDLDGALRVAEAALERHGDEPSVLLAYAMALKDTGKRDGDLEAVHRALDVYARVVELEPDCPWAAADRGYSLFELASLTQDRRPLEPALAELARAVELRPSNSYFHWTQGVVTQALGDLETAAQALRRSVEIHDDAPHAWERLAMCQEGLGDLEGALLSLERALHHTAPDAAEQATLSRAQARLRAKLGR
jgi:tetratricopeptide (TPR) repeat protein